MRYAFVLLACGLCLEGARADDADLQKRVDRAADRAKQSLIQQVDSLRGKTGINIPPLSLHALLHAGLSPNHPLVQDWIRELDRNPQALQQEIGNCYQAGVLALVLSDLHDPKAKGRDFKLLLQHIANALASGQAPSGSWGYTTGDLGAKGGSENISTAQYALLGLQAAFNRGARIPDAVWRKAALYFLDDQQPRVPAGDYRAQPAGWAYGSTYGAGTPYNSHPYGSMTAVGVASLLICSEHIPEGEPLQRRIRAGVDAGTAWLGEHFSVKEHPGISTCWGNGFQSQAFLYYYLYSLERAGSFAATDRFGKHAWYREGAEQLLKTQDEDGGWKSAGWGEDPVTATSFALLFLKRASVGITKASYTVGEISPKEQFKEGLKSMIAKGDLETLPEKAQAHPDWIYEAWQAAFNAAPQRFAVPGFLEALEKRGRKDLAKNLDGLSPGEQGAARACLEAGGERPDPSKIAPLLATPVSRLDDMVRLCPLALSHLPPAEFAQAARQASQSIAFEPKQGIQPILKTPFAWGKGKGGTSKQAMQTPTPIQPEPLVALRWALKLDRMLAAASVSVKIPALQDASRWLESLPPEAEPSPRNTLAAWEVLDLLSKRYPLGKKLEERRKAAEAARKDWVPRLLGEAVDVIEDEWSKPGDRITALESLEAGRKFQDVLGGLGLSPSEQAFLARCAALPEDPGEAAKGFAALVSEDPVVCVSLWRRWVPKAEEKSH